VAEARRLHAALNRPNVMIKVPATPAGIVAIESLIGQGININVTLMFSLAHYEVVAEAYLRGLEKLAAGGGDLSRVASVASFFLSRIDSAVDEQLAAIGTDQALILQGKTAIANAKVTYRRFQEIFSGERWGRLAGQGARPQRVLWASTSTKNPSYPDTLYIDQLIGPETVNTVPPATLQAFFDHGTAAVTITERVSEARAHLALLSALGIDLEQITERLQDEGVAKFAEPFRSLLASIEEKAAKLQARQTAEAVGIEAAGG
jgi:transaldolase